MSDCTHLDDRGYETVEVRLDLDAESSEEAYWKCTECGQELSYEEADALNLPPASEAWLDAKAAQDELSAYYERTRGV